MLAWISANIATIVISLVLAALVAGIVMILKADRKKGKASCGGSCGHCPMSCSCHGGEAAAKPDAERARRLSAEEG